MPVWWTLGIDARAQDLADPDLPGDLPPSPEDGSGEAPPPLAPALPDWRSGHEWVAVGPAGVGSLTSVAAAADPALWAVAQADGTVFLTEDAGRRWARVLDPYLVASNDEEVLREVEARLKDLGSDLGSSGWVSEDDLQQFAQDAQQASQQVVDDVQAELDAGPWFLEHQAALAGDWKAAHPRVWFTSDGRLVVGRADGLRVHEHTAAGWEPRWVWTEPVTAFTELPDHTFLVGLADGLVRGTRDLRDFEGLSALDGQRVTDLRLEGGLLASTTEGVWWTAEGVSWVHLPIGAEHPVHTAMSGPRPPDPTTAALDMPLLVGTEATILRTSDPGRDLGGPVEGGPMPDTSAFARRSDGLLLAASAAGPWQSDDGGASWESLALGEAGVRELHDVEVVGDSVLLVGVGGLWRLEPRRALPAAEPPRWVPLGALVNASLGRPELEAHVGSRWVAAMMPDVTLQGDWRQNVGDDWDADTWTTHDVDTTWRLRMALTWRPGRQQTSSSFDVLDPTADLSVVLLDGQVVIDDGTSGTVLASAVRRGATQYRDELAESIGQLWRERQRLVAEGTPAVAPLTDRVRQVLRILEIEARLDALCDGAVSEWDPGSPDPRKRRGG